MSETEDIYLRGHDQASAAFASVQKSCANLVDQVKDTASQFENIGNVTAAVSVSLLASAGFVKSMYDAAAAAADVGDRLNDMSKKTGIAVESLSTYRLAADMSGTSLEGLAQGMKFLGKSMVEATDPTKATAAVFKSLGIDMTDAKIKAMSTEEVFKLVSDRFQQMPDGAEKSTAAMNLFGRAGVSLIPILNEGSKAIQAMQNDAAALGQQWSKLDAEMGDQFNDTAARMKSGAGSIKETVGKTLMPYVQTWMEGVVLLEQDVLGMFKKTDEAALTSSAALRLHNLEQKKLLASAVQVTVETAEQLSGLSQKEMEEIDKVAKLESADYQKRFENHQQWMKDIQSEIEKEAEHKKKLDEQFNLEIELAMQRERIRIADEKIQKAKEVAAAEKQAELDKLAELDRANADYLTRYRDRYSQLDRQVSDLGETQQSVSARQDAYVQKSTAEFRQWAASIDATKNAEQDLGDTADHLWDDQIALMEENGQKMKAYRLQIEAATAAIEAQYQATQKLAGAAFQKTLVGSTAPGGGGYSIGGYTSANFTPHGFSPSMTSGGVPITGGWNPNVTTSAAPVTGLDNPTAAASAARTVQGPPPAGAPSGGQWETDTDGTTQPAGTPFLIHAPPTIGGGFMLSMPAPSARAAVASESSSSHPDFSQKSRSSEYNDSLIAAVHKAISVMADVAARPTIVQVDGKAIAHTVAKASLQGHATSR